MVECCSKLGDEGDLRSRHRCPVNGREYKEVSIKTMLHHIKNPWEWGKKSQGYYFCDDPECEVVYFGRDDSIINRSDLRTKVGVKEKSGDAMLCYCFGVTTFVAIKYPQAREFVVEQTKENICECEARNPSGRCCLKDFPKM